MNKRIVGLSFLFTQREDPETDGFNICDGAVVIHLESITIIFNEYTIIKIFGVHKLKQSNMISLYLQFTYINIHSPVLNNLTNSVALDGIQHEHLSYKIRAFCK